ncbi:MAG TPA: 5'-nucleosidase [Steroidobacteraceae bacterium]|nr:5'-nucleosidase [Steroidobacteraceae bacterium]
MPPLVVMAREVESQGLFAAAGVPVLYTGVGKINAAHALTRKLTEHRLTSGSLPRVINFGTAGSHTLPTGSLVACRSFVQRDMDVTALGFSLGTTPFDSVPALIEFPAAVPSLPHYVCSTGDSFQTRREIASDVLDMEAYALAKVCWLEKAEFTCVKYITDGADHAAATDWQANLPKAAAEFLRIYRSLEAGP